MFNPAPKRGARFFSPNPHPQVNELLYRRGDVADMVSAHLLAMDWAMSSQKKRKMATGAKSPMWMDSVLHQLVGFHLLKNMFVFFLVGLKESLSLLEICFFRGLKQMEVGGYSIT